MHFFEWVYVRIKDKREKKKTKYSFVMDRVTIIDVHYKLSYHLSVFLFISNF